MRIFDWLTTYLMAAGLISSIACSGTTDSSDSNAGGAGSHVDTTPGTGPVAVENVAHEFAIVFCDLIARCYGSYGIAGGSDLGACIGSIELTLGDQLTPQLQAAMTQGTVSYDASAMRACLDGFHQLSCDYANQSNLLDHCQSAWSGHLQVGEPCQSNMECANGMSATYCASEGTCPGSCKTRGNLGASCKSDSECVDGLACASSGETCVQRLNLGDTCNPSSEADGACGGLTRCQTDSTGTGHCAGLVQGAEGDSCNSYGSCASGLVCMATGETTDASSNSVVLRCQKTSPSGGLCRYALGNPCPTGQYCPVSYSDMGATQAQCTAQLAPGAQCTGSTLYECANDGSCGSDYTCIARQHIGGPCKSDGDCYSYECNNSVCAAHWDCLQ